MQATDSPNILNVDPKTFTKLQQLIDLSDARQDNYREGDRTVDFRFAINEIDTGSFDTIRFDESDLDEIKKNRDPKERFSNDHSLADFDQVHTVKVTLPTDRFLTITWREIRREALIVSAHSISYLDDSYMHGLATMTFGGSLDIDPDGMYSLMTAVVDIRDKRIVWRENVFLEGMTKEKDRETTLLGESLVIS